MESPGPATYPDAFFVFVDLSNPLTQHNLSITGTLFSSPDFGGDPVPLLPNPAFSGALSPMVARMVTEYRAEYEGERVRLDVAPDAPSRFTALYAFGDEATCHSVAALHGWDVDTVRKFELQHATKIRRANMELASLARGAAFASADPAILERLWAAYWNGASDHSDPGIAPVASCTWEYLIEGVLRIV